MSRMTDTSSAPALPRKAIGGLESLERAFADHTARIGIIGLGYVGLPLAHALAAARFQTVGFDIDETKIRQLKRGKTSIVNIDPRKLRHLLNSGYLKVTNDVRKLSEMDAIIICVPTPLTSNREPDLSYVISTTETIVGGLKSGQLILLESTTFPGTTLDVVRPILERRGLKSGKDFFLAYSPEREDPGNNNFDVTRTPKVVGGDGPEALRLACTLYETFVASVVPVSSPGTAEAVKLTENIFRAVNIALVNELKIVFDEMGIDIWEVIEAAKTKPFGYMPFYPGPGLGGHCIPIDPFYLTWKAREYGISTRFIELAGEINTAMPRYIVERLTSALSDHDGKALKGARILLIGVAYKKNVGDMRESPALRIFELLERREAIVEFHDPFVPKIPPTREHGGLTGRQSVDLSPEAVSACDVALICTDHDNLDYDLLVKLAPLVIDTRNILARQGLTGANIVKA